MARKTADPKLIALLDAQEKARLAYARWYMRMRRAVAKLEKARLRIASLERRIAAHQSPTPSPPKETGSCSV
jgi:hypothetical protein